MKEDVKRMKVTMLQTTPGSEDGVNIGEFIQGKTYNMEESLAKAFLGMKVAKVAAKVGIEAQVIKGPGPDETQVDGPTQTVESRTDVDIGGADPGGAYPEGTGPDKKKDGGTE